MESRNQKIPQASPLDIDGSNESSAIAVCKIRTTFFSSSWMNCRPTQPVVRKPTISPLWSQKSRPQTWKPPTHAGKVGLDVDRSGLPSSPLSEAELNV